MCGFNLWGGYKKDHNGAGKPQLPPSCGTMEKAHSLPCLRSSTRYRVISSCCLFGLSRFPRAVPSPVQGNVCYFSGLFTLFDLPSSQFPTRSSCVLLSICFLRLYRVMSGLSNCVTFFPGSHREILHHDWKGRLDAEPGHHSMCYFLAVQAHQ